MESLENIKLIVCDMDGTLLHDDQSMDNEIIEVVKKLKDKDIYFTFATGRNVHIMKNYIHQFQLDIPYITNNGANIFLKDTCIFEQDIERKDLQYILTLLETLDLPYLAYSNTSLYVPREDPSIERFMNRLRGTIDIHVGDKIKDIVKCEIFKIVMIQEDEKLMKQVSEEVAKACLQAHCMRTEGNIYSISNSNVSKGAALIKLLEDMKITREEVVVFGDNFNDVSMFKEAKYAIAMANSEKSIKQFATHITKMNNENGVSDFIKTYIL